MKRLNRFFQSIEDHPYHPGPLFLIILVVGIGRTIEEIYLGHLSHGLSGASHFVSYYLVNFIGFVAIAAILLGKSWEKLAQVVVLGVFAGLVPPLIDTFWIGPGQFHYNYLDRFYVTLHGAGNPPSEAIVAWTVLVAFSLYLYVRGGSVLRALVGLGLGYLYLVLMGYENPPFIKKLFEPLSGGAARGFLCLFLAFGFYVVLNLRRFVPSLKRINHSLPWVVLVFLGASLAGGIQRMTWLHAGIVLLVHQGIIFANDYYDRESDRLNQRHVLIDRNDLLVVHGLIVWLVLHVCFVQPKLGLLYLLYLLLTTAYHHPVLRLKRIFPLNYALEGLVAALALLIGIASTGRTDLTRSELIYVALAFAGFALGSPFKDYKDVKGDRATGIRTLYVLLEERGWTVEKSHQWMSTILLCFLTVPPLLLFFKGAGIVPVVLILAGFLIAVFFSLRSRKETSAVERTIWILIGYLIAIVLALNFALPSPHREILKDYGGLKSGVTNYSAVRPTSLDEVVEIVQKANRDKTPIRVRGKGHSMDGSSLPRAHELLIHTDQLRWYHFEAPGSINVGAGIRMSELRSFLKDFGYGLPVTNDGGAGPSVGGYMVGGGIGVGSRQYGGFWDNVLEITLVTGAGEVLQLKPGDDLFPWMFGSMGQLGIIVSARLKILGEDVAAYPLNEKGTIPSNEAEATGHLVWFTVFVPEDELETVKVELQRIKEVHSNALKYRRDYVYPIKFTRFNPKLLFPSVGDFVGVGIWGKPKTADRSLLLGLERDVMKLVMLHHDTPYRRYIQTELVSPNIDYEAYFGNVIYEEFLALKKRLDPNCLLNCGFLVECNGPK